MIVYQHKCTCKHTPKYNKTYKKKSQSNQRFMLKNQDQMEILHIYTYKELVQKKFFLLFFGTLSNCNDNFYYFFPSNIVLFSDISMHDNSFSCKRHIMVLFFKLISI